MISLPADMMSVQNAGHRVVPRLWTRTPTPADKWIQLRTLDATVTLDRAGVWPGRSLSARVMLETDGIVAITESIDDKVVDWGHAPLSPFGSWVKAEQVVYRMDGTSIVVPWGVYRVDEIAVDELSAIVTITATDASSQVDDRPFVTLAQGRVLASQSIQARMSSILTDVFSGGIVPFWSTLIDFNGMTDKVYGGKGGQYTESRLDALGALCAKMTSGWRLVCPRSGSLFKAVHPGDPDATAAFVTVKQNLLYDAFGDVVTRDGLFNEVVATYQVTNPDTYGQTRTQQRRVVAQYVDAGEELAGTGPFGWSTRDTVQVDIPAGTADPDGYVKDKAYDVIGRSFSASRTVSLRTGPIYGIEQGDPVYVQVEETGARRRGTLVGATIPLHADGGPWDLDVVMVDTLDPSWVPRYYVIVDQTQYEDNFSWVDFRPTGKVDLDTGTGSGKTKKLWQGWTVDNASKLVGGATLTATSDGGQVVFRTSARAWGESASEHRYQAKASLTAVSHSIKARIGLDTDIQGVIWSDWQSFTVGKGRTVTIDTKRAVNPSALTFGIRVETQGMSSGWEVRLNSASVERAVRNKT